MAAVLSRKYPAKAPELFAYARRIFHAAQIYDSHAMTTYIDARPPRGTALTGQWKISRSTMRLSQDGPSSQLDANTDCVKITPSRRARRCYWCSCRCHWYRPHLRRCPNLFRIGRPLPSNPMHRAARCAGSTTRIGASLGSAATRTFVVSVLAHTLPHCALKPAGTRTLGGVDPIEGPVPPEP